MYTITSQLSGVLESDFSGGVEVLLFLRTNLAFRPSMDSLFVVAGALHVLLSAVSRGAEMYQEADADVGEEGDIGVGGFLHTVFFRV